MSFFDVVKLFGGLALFLFGMTTMAAGLEKAAGSKLESTLKRLTKNPVTAVLFGALLTAAVQSSSATTVMVVGLVNSGIMQMSQAIGVIMGANIGTTFTAQILSLGDIASDNFFLLLLKPATIAPIISCVGAALFIFAKKERFRNWGQAAIGFGILFTGMFTMEAAVYPLRSSPLFAELFSTLQNPVLGVLVGAGVTAIIQSSSASVGILQALSSTGIISWSTAVPIILGQNIGTCVTPMMASIGASKAAKRSAFCHLYFNIIGTSLFLIIIYGIQYTVGIPFWNEVVGRSDIANFHTIFNILVTLILLPFTKLLAYLATNTIKDKDEPTTKSQKPVLDERLLSASPLLAIEQAQSMINYMAVIAKDNFALLSSLLKKHDEEILQQIRLQEKELDEIEVETAGYLIKITHKELTEQESDKVSMLLHLLSDFERIGDRVESIANTMADASGKKSKLSDNAKEELALLCEAVSENIDLSIKAAFEQNLDMALRVEPLEEAIDQIVEQLRNRHVMRLKKGKCNIEAGLIFIEILSGLERISDYCSNIAGYSLYLIGGSEDYNNHLLKSSIKEHRVDKAIMDAIEEYEKRYLHTLKE